MKTRILFATALAILAAPGIVMAEDYAKPGQLEAGGFFGIASQEETIKPDGGSESTNKLMVIQVDPTVGYFVADGFEVLGQLHVTQVAIEFDGVDDKASLTEIGLGAGAGYFVNLGVARLGPQAILRFGTSALSFGDSSSDETLTGGQLGAFAKVPIGGGGVIAAGLVYDHMTIARTDDTGALKFDSKGTRTEIGARVGYFVFF